MAESSDFLKDILTHGPSQKTIFMTLTEMKKQGRNSEVIQECLKALELYHDDIRLRTLLAETYLDEGQMEPAEEELNRVTSEIDGISVGYRHLAQLLVKQERFEEASKPLRRYLALNPDDQDALELLESITPEEPTSVETVISDETDEPAVPEKEPAAESFAAEPAPLSIDPEIEPIEDTSLAEGVETSASRTEATQDAVMDVVEEGPEEPLVDLATPTLAELYFEQGQTKEAILTYEKVIMNDPSDKASHERLAELKAQMEERPGPATPSPEDALRKRTENTIKILENWRARIRARSNV